MIFGLVGGGVPVGDPLGDIGEPLGAPFALEGWDGVIGVTPIGAFWPGLGGVTDACRPRMLAGI